MGGGRREGLRHCHRGSVDSPVVVGTSVMEVH